MEFVTLLLSSIGGATTVLLGLAFFGKNVVNFWLNRELESYKAEISHKNSEALEKLKSEQLLIVSAQERSIEIQMIMERYRAPLLHAANDLQSRIYNLVQNYVIDIYFIEKSGGDSEREYFIKNTTFLIAQYFAWTEIIRREIQFIEFDDIDSTRTLSILQSNLCSIWQGQSRLDISIWAGEQRGIGELMIEEKGDKIQCVGYSKFLKLLEESERGLLIELESRVRNHFKSEKKYSHRLVSVQNALIDVVEFLDPENKRFDSQSLKKIPIKNI
ncbi:hypothetical protein [Vibrio fluvialis]|uniref:hypothetical protein n=1 Tax=Vibrio fluvialis TaxID=676 RepID=UPI0015587ADA|nr:hypothetical protein [Vibrio fluvialis]